MEHKLYELHATMCRVFTSPKRLEILNRLRDKELSVGQLAKIAKIRQANISQHLSILREKGIVKTRRDGVTVYYSLANPKILKAFDIIREMLLEKLAEGGRFMEQVNRGGR
ncbi:MAG: transcriptional regulator [Omnitrophica bacterium RIFOXYB12_FULL_50_7]|nr:MAG: transcriptional regulator [Omnitrophica bacterium RIFOXYB12_FULL_50_7]